MKGSGSPKKGRAKGSGRGYDGDMKVSENLDIRGLFLAMRVAPQESDSSPGYFTIVRWRLHSFANPRIVLEKAS
jgi:hypothetical protein